MRVGTLKYHLLIFVLIISGLNQISLAQPEITSSEASQLTERTFLVTDREIYSVDEDILFSAFNMSSASLRNAAWSNVLYIELMSPDGEVFVSKKISYNHEGAKGTFRIPNSLLTGNYYLRAYTRWMRDYSPYHYFYKMIKVINPFHAELLEPSVINALKESEVMSASENSANIKINTNKKRFTKREQVDLDVSTSAVMFDKLAVSVIPQGTEKQLAPRMEELQELRYSPDFIPETRGLSISGKVVNATDTTSLAYILVSLTIFKENPENRNVLTNEKGQFFFDLSTLEGEYELFISAKPKEGKTPLILVDNDFSMQKITLPYVEFDLSGESIKLYQKLIFNSQIQALYKKQNIHEEQKAFSSNSSFYGTPDFVLKVADYIALSNVKDYIYELMPQVGVRNEGKQIKVKVLGPYSELALNDPLVLVDMVPIFDIDKVLSLPPDKIDRFEVVTTPYIRGDIVFGGIFSIFSKNSDLAGIDLPSTGRFITYKMLSSERAPIAPTLNNIRIPDLCNCLYWNPEMKLNEGEMAKISFNVGDDPGQYLIVVQGIDNNGQYVRSTEMITVE